MFFPERIKNIKPGDRVLEIGPGATPFHRSDVLLEKKFENEQEYASQFGTNEKIKTTKTIVYYDGNVFPFKDNEFDYVICSHVLEHVSDVSYFLSEIFRVGKRGYLEYPLIYYEYLYNFDVHLNYLKYDGQCLRFMKKDKSNLSEFKPVQDFFLQSLRNGHVKMINELITYFMEGFEWENKFKLEEVSDISLVCHRNAIVPPAQQDKRTPGNLNLLKQFIKKSIKR